MKIKDKIFIVEDDEINAFKLNYDLESLGYEVIGVAASAAQAHEVLKNKMPDLILMDIYIEGDIDGVKLMGSLKEKMDVPFIYLSGVTDPDIMLRAIKTSPENFIRKPYEKHELSFAIEKALEKVKLKRKILESENFYRSIIENSSDGIYSINENNDVISSNSIAEKLFGIKKNKIVTKKYFDLYKGLNTKNLNLIKNLDVNSIIEVPIKLNISGNKSWIEISMSLISNNDGGRTRTHFIRDVTTKKRDEIRKTLTLNIAKAANKYSDDFDSFALFLHETLNLSIDVGQCSLSMLNKSSNKLETLCVQESVTREINDLQGGIEELVITSKKPITLNKNQFNDFYIKNNIFIPTDENVTSLHITPLTIEKEIAGTITIKSFTKNNQYDSLEAEIMTFVATQMSNIIAQQKSAKAIGKMASAVNNSSSALISCNLEGEVDFVNPTTVKMWGYENQQEMLKENPLLFDYFPKLVSSFIRMAIKKVFSSGENFLSNSNGIVCENKKGNEFLSQLSISPIIDGKGIQTGITCSFIDITKEKKRAVNYKTILETMIEGVIRVDNDEKIEYVNDNFCKLSGYDSNYLIGKNANTLFTVNNEMSKKFKKRAQDRFKGVSEQYETLFRKKNGDAIWIRSSSAPVKNEYDKIVGSIGIITDISEIKKAARQVEKSEEKYKQLANVAMDGLVVINKNKKLVLFNPAAEKMFGYKESEISGMDISELIISKSSNNTGNVLIDYKKGELVYGIKSDGSELPIETSFVEIKIDNELFFSTFIRNVSQEKQHEIKLVNALIEGQENERKRISKELHDGLGQRLAALNMNLSAMRSFANKHEAYDRMLVITKETIEEYRSVAHALMPPSLKDNTLNFALQIIVSRLDQSSEIDFVFKDTENEIHFSEKLKIELFRITQELINNAIKYAKASRITVKLELKNNRFTLSVEDNGVGFDIQKLPKNNSGIGIGNIYSRANFIDGIFNLTSITGKGSKAEVIIQNIDS